MYIEVLMHGKLTKSTLKQNHEKKKMNIIIHAF